jgi:rhodanese-related sulfurtransferase
MSGVRYSCAPGQSSSLDGIPEATLREMMDESSEHPPLVIIYDTAGTRAASVASQLSQHLHGKTVFNMCGGLVSPLCSLSRPPIFMFL